jgi:hypothetical protein
MSRSLLTDEEVKALLAAEFDDVRAQNRKWFWLRSSFVLCYVAVMIAGLIFFPERILSKFNLPDEMSAQVTEKFLLLRITTVLAATMLYLFSYWRNWYFSHVALAAVLVAIGNLINDTFTFYIYTRPDAWFVVQAVVALRLFIIVLLVMNFLGARNEFRRLD